MQKRGLSSLIDRIICRENAHARDNISELEKPVARLKNYPENDIEAIKWLRVRGEVKTRPLLSHASFVDIVVPNPPIEYRPVFAS